MILSFKTHFKDGTLTHFRRKIFRHLGEDALYDYIDKHIQDPFLALILEDEVMSAIPKKLTIRDDPHNRWKAGRKIHFATGVRTKNYECFAMGECTKTNTVVFAKNKESNQILVFLEGRDLTESEVKQLAQDDGFDDVYAFLDFHLGKNTIATKKIIYF